MKPTNNTIWIIITSISVMVSLILAILLGVNSASNTTTTSSSSQGITKGMPADAATSATDWVIDRFTEINKTVPADFFSTSSTQLTKLSSGDFSFIPEKTRNALEFTDDVSASSRTISKSVMSASAYSAIIMASQTYGTVLSKVPTLKTNLKLVSVDKERGLVYIPLEAVDSVPADITIVLKWSGSQWVFDGDYLGYTMSAKIRMSEASASSSSSSSSSSK